MVSWKFCPTAWQEGRQCSSVGSICMCTIIKACSHVRSRALDDIRGSMKGNERCRYWLIWLTDMRSL